MNRSSLKRKPHKDPVTTEMHQFIFGRDEMIVLATMAARGEYRKGWGQPPHCVAWVLDPSHKCSGRWTLDHVQDDMTEKKGMTIAGTRRGVRAPSDPEHLVALCEGATENGMRAGYKWNTAHRPELRDYLRRFGR